MTRAAPRAWRRGFAVVAVLVALLVACSGGGDAGSGTTMPATSAAATSSTRPAQPDVPTDATQPPQPDSGPGGSDYAHGDWRVSSGGTGSDAWYVFEPVDPQPRSAPVTVVMHGYFEYAGYDQLHEFIRHTVRTGSIVVYPRWQTGVAEPCPGPADIEPCLTSAANGIRGALDFLDADPERVQPDQERAGYFGFSFGGIITADLANRHDELGLPTPRAIFLDDPHDGGVTGTDEPALDDSLAGIPASTLVVCHSGARGRDLGAGDGRRRLQRRVPEARRHPRGGQGPRHGPPRPSRHAAPRRRPRRLHRPAGGRPTPTTGGSAGRRGTPCGRPPRTGPTAGTRSATPPSSGRTAPGATASASLRSWCRTRRPSARDRRRARVSHPVGMMDRPRRFSVRSGRGWEGDFRRCPRFPSPPRRPSASRRPPPPRRPHPRVRRPSGPGAGHLRCRPAALAGGDGAGRLRPADPRPRRHRRRRATPRVGRRADRRRGRPPHSLARRPGTGGVAPRVVGHRLPGRRGARAGRRPAVAHARVGDPPDGRRPPGGRVAAEGPGGPAPSRRRPPRARHRLLLPQRPRAGGVRHLGLPAGGRGPLHAPPGDLVGLGRGRRVADRPDRLEPGVAGRPLGLRRGRQPPAGVPRPQRRRGLGRPPPPGTGAAPIRRSARQ